MCKSQLGMCYSLVKVNEGVKSIVSGCADSLQEEPELSTCAGRGAERNVAEVVVNETKVVEEKNGLELKETTVIETAKETDNIKTNNVDVTKTGLICCTQDMCNYRDSNEITITIDTKTHDLNNGKQNDNIQKLDLYISGCISILASKRTVEILPALKLPWTRSLLLLHVVSCGFQVSIKCRNIASYSSNYYKTKIMLSKTKWELKDSENKYHILSRVCFFSSTRFIGPPICLRSHFYVVILD